MSLISLRSDPQRPRSASEAARELGVPEHVLAYWERRFPSLAPARDASGARFYQSEDLALLRQIRFRLYVEGYTITGVTQLLEKSAMADCIANDQVRACDPRALQAAASEAASAGLFDAKQATGRLARLREVLARLEAAKADLDRFLEPVPPRARLNAG